MYVRQLKTSLALNFVLAALTPIVFLSLIVLLHLSHDIKNEIEDRNLLLAKTVSGQVEVFLREPLSTLDNISAILKANPSWSYEEIQQLLDLHIRDSKLFESIFMLDKNGIIENAGLPIGREEFHEDHKGINLAHLPVYKNAKATNEPTWSNTFLSVMSGNISIALCIPEKEFSLIGNLNIKILSDFVQSLNEDQRTQVALIDRNGTIIVHPDPLLGQTQVNINNLSIIRQGFEGKEETTRFTFNNINYIGSTKKIVKPDWLVLVSQSVKEAYHGILTTAHSFIIVALGAALLAILFALIKTQKIISPITEVANHAQQIADGDYRVQFTRSPYTEIRELTTSIQHMADAVKLRETELQMSQKRFREIYNTTGEAIFIRNAQTFDLVDANEAMTELFGYSLDELKEKPISELSSGDPNFTKQKAKEKISKALHEGPQVFEWSYVRKNGEPFWAEVALKKAEIDGKKRLLGVIRNITERKTLERQLAQSQKMEAIGTLAGGIAHDFNNILTPIMGYVEMSMLHLNEPDRMKEDMNHVLRAVHRAKELVQQILTFSRQEGQQATPTNVAIIIKEALKLLRSSIPSTINIKQYIDPECGTVMANPTQIHQVLMNLCTNAYHAMREDGGMMSVSLVPTTISSPDNPVLKNLPEGPYLRLEVSDTGHGMDKSTLNRVMEPYFTTKKDEEGTGLGLSVVHGIVKGIGGEITVYSEVGKGSTFRVFFPAIEQTVISASFDRKTPPPRGNECLILVDDEEMILDMQQEMLSRLGYNIKTFSEPEKALEFLRDKSSPCDLLITDMTMPKMTGMALAKKIRESDPDLPIIVCTGFSETINKEEALAQGINDFLTKPVELHQLARSVRETLDQKKTPPA